MNTNQTGVLDASGGWQKVSLQGDVLVNCDSLFEFALSPDENSVPSFGHSLRAGNYHRNGLLAFKVPENCSFWVKAVIDSTFVITSTNYPS